MDLLEFCRDHAAEIEVLADRRALFLLTFIAELGNTTRATLSSHLGWGDDVVEGLWQKLKNAGLVRDESAFGRENPIRLSTHGTTMVGALGFPSEPALLGNAGAIRQPAGPNSLDKRIMTDQFEFVIVRRDDVLSSADLKSRLEASPGWDSSLQIKIVKSTLDTRPADPTFLSILTAGAAALGALFGALGGVAQSLGKHKIVMRWADGTSVEVEGRNAEEIVKKVIPLLEAKPGSKIVISV